MRRTSNGAQFVTDRSPVVSRRALLQQSALFGAALSSPWLLSACDVAGDPGSEAAGQGRLRFRTIDEFSNADPAIVPFYADGLVALCVNENLVAFRGNSAKVMPELAAELTSSEDGLSHEFRLKEGIQFHGGYGEMTAEDVKYSFERIAGLTHPPLKEAEREYWSTLEGVQVTGRYTGVIRLKEPLAPLFSDVLPNTPGMVISKAAYEELGEGFATHPIGTGPYEFVRGQPGREVLLRRFDKWGGASLGWAGAKPVWKEISLHPILEDSSARIALETGEVDFTQIAYADVDSMSADERFKVTKLQTFAIGWVGFNVTDKTLSDVRVRRAIRQALDVDAMITAAFEGKTTRAYSLVAPAGSPLGYWRDAPKYQRDVNKAKALLADAGVEGFEITMAIDEADPGSVVIAEIVQANLKDIGIDVSVRKTSGGEIYEKVGALQMFYLSWAAQDDPWRRFELFTSGQLGQSNMMSWSNKEYDSLNETAKKELDEDRRHRLYVRMQQIMDEDAVAAWVDHSIEYYAHSPELIPSPVAGIFPKFRAWNFRIEGA